MTPSSRRASRRSPGRIDPWRWREKVLLGLLVVSICIGGGGIPASPLNLVVQVICLLALGLIRADVARFLKSAPRSMIVLLALTISLPALQLVPLPPALWQALPGRGSVVQSLELIGATRSWMPLSLDPARTAVALMAVLGCLPIVILAATLERRSARLVPVTVAAMGVLSAVLGALQLSMGNQGVVLQPRGVMRHQLYATFANHNTSGLFFVICLVCLTAIKADWLGDRLRSGRGVRRGSLANSLSRNVPAMKIVLGALFVLCTVLSQSRSALLTLAAVLVWLVFRYRADIATLARRSVGAGGRRAWLAAGLLVVAVGGALTVAGNRSVRESFSRFDEVDDPRLAIWQDVSSTVHRYMPVGAGVGAFAEVFSADESLEIVSPLRVARAHNDYLEALVESGLAGPLLIFAWAIWIAARAWQARGGRNAAQAVMACAVMVCLALQSAVDYPLRNMAMLAIAASMIGLLARSAGSGSRSEDAA